jgi:prophage maintenance system killer protein
MRVALLRKDIALITILKSTMENTIEIYESSDNQTTVTVRFEGETVWLNRQQLAELFDRDIKTIGKHINNIFSDGELIEHSVVANFATTANDGKVYQVEHYNLDVIISVGYRVKSLRGIQFRQWATRRLTEYLLQGYAINEQRLAEKQMQVETLKTGIRIFSRAIDDHATRSSQTDGETLRLFAKGLTLLDDYDHETLDDEGKTREAAIYPTMEEYLNVVSSMQSAFASDVFAKPKDGGFESAIQQIRQSFAGEELYPSIEEKAATLLYLIVKNHAFADGNKRIGAACFLHFLERNNLLLRADNEPIISNDALASLTLFVASSKREEMQTVKKVILSMLNRR